MYLLGKWYHLFLGKLAKRRSHQRSLFIEVVDRESAITVTKKLAEFRQTPGVERDIG